VSWLVVSVHDVHPATALASRAWVADLDRLGWRSSLLVVPGPWRGATLLHNRPMATWLHERVDRGDEIVQHGWRHEGVPGGSPWRSLLNHVVARGCAEFGGLDEAAAAERLSRGGEVLDRLGFRVDGFTPPGWLASPGTSAALRRLGYRYTTTHVGVHDLHRGVVRRAPALCHRPGGGLAERLGVGLLRAGVRRAVAEGRPIRVALHPADRARPGLVDATLEVLAAAIDAGARSTTYGDVVAGTLPMRLVA
jgi:predicted deacetylase